MTDCKGLFGKLFGHEFEKYMIKDSIPIAKTYDIDISVAREFFNAMRKEYEIRCKRCGCKVDE